jgi:hypothetical protein
VTTAGMAGEPSSKAQVSRGLSQAKECAMQLSIPSPELWIVEAYNTYLGFSSHF